MTVQLLISTMHQTDRSLLQKMNVSSDAVVVNQCDREGKETLTYNGHQVLWIDTTERGLSKSRNMAIRHATADICFVSDDDMVYRNDYAETARAAFSRVDADIIRFQVRGIEKTFRNYAPEEEAIGYLKSMKISSVEIAFKLSVFREKNILFDELIGSGTEFMMGEENVMLFQCLQKGMRIYYVPAEIADLHIGNSTWFHGMNDAFFVGKGAAFAAMKTPYTFLLIWQWAVRKRRMYRENASVWHAVRQMQKGKRLYREKAAKKP